MMSDHGLIVTLFAYKVYVNAVLANLNARAGLSNQDVVVTSSAPPNSVLSPGSKKYGVQFANRVCVFSQLTLSSALNSSSLAYSRSS